MSKNYFVNCLFDSGFECEIGRDGLLYRITYEQAKVILAHRPYNKKECQWFFNQSLDRICADYDPCSHLVVVNPAVMIGVGELLVMEVD